MKISRLLSYLNYYRQFIPIRFNFVLFIIILILSFRWLKTFDTETSSFSGIAMLMSKIALIFALLVLTISFLSSFICWLYFMIQKSKQGKDVIELSMDLENYQNNLLRIRTKLPFALKPILGFVKVKLMYDKTKLTDQYIVGDRLKKQFISFNTGLSSLNTLQLPDIKEYHFSNAIISFEDMLQFFSFTLQSDVNQVLCNLPHSLLHDTNELPPKKTEEELIRIEQLRKVEGEYLNYKKFEDSDDVRRIVWKIFAKNKELVVRIPEIMDPYASHLYMYASYFNQSHGNMHNEFQQEMLNHFKNCVWTIYDALSNKEFDVRYISDQTIAAPGEDINATKYCIALSDWHHDKNLIDYFKPANGTVLCIHSFTPEKELEQLLASCDGQTNIFFIQLSKVFRSHYFFNWILRIFVKPQSDRLTSLRNKWAIHPFKFQTIQHEKALLSILKKSELNLEII